MKCRLKGEKGGEVPMAITTDLLILLGRGQAKMFTMLTGGVI